jgi:hypothetical protein
VKRTITYFEKPGKINTDAVLEIVKTRAQELQINTIVVASYRGFTAEKAVKALHGQNIIVIGGFLEPNPQNLSETFSQGDEKLIREKATVLIATHLFSGINRAVRKKFDTSSPGEIAAQTLRMVGTGVKVAIECAVLRPVNSQDFFDLRLKEILCKPLVG